MKANRASASLLTLACIIAAPTGAISAPVNFVRPALPATAGLGSPFIQPAPLRAGTAFNAFKDYLASPSGQKILFLEPSLQPLLAVDFESDRGRKAIR